MKVLWLSLMLSFFSLQSEYHVQKIWLFTKIQYAGNVPVSRDGAHLRSNPVILICYLKMSSKTQSPDWETAVVDGKQYRVGMEQVNEDSVTVGTLKNTNSPVIITAGPDSKLVQLTLMLPGKIEKPEAWSFILNGTLNGKPVYIRPNDAPVELAPVFMP